MNSDLKTKIQDAISAQENAERHARAIVHELAAEYARNGNGRKAGDFAADYGITRRTWFYFMKGERIPSLNQLREILRKIEKGETA